MMENTTTGMTEGTMQQTSSAEVNSDQATANYAADEPTQTTQKVMAAPMEQNVSGSGTGSTRSLYRSPNNKVVAGVCGGMGEFLGIDPTLVRIAWVILTFVTGGGGFFAYIALWALLPVGTQAQGKLQPAAIDLNDKTLARTAYLLIGLGALWLLANVGILPRVFSFAWSVVGVLFWPALLIGAGYLLLRNSGRNWRGDVDSVKTKVQTGVDGKVPSSDEMRNGFASIRQNFPLKRSTDNRVFLGVCGGIGERLGIDPNLVRLVWAALSVGSIGLGVIAYVAIGLLLPEETPADVAKRAAEPQDVTIVDGTIG